MNEIVEQTEMIADAFVAFTVQIPTALSSPSKDIVERISKFNRYVLLLT